MEIKLKQYTHRFLCSVCFGACLTHGLPPPMLQGPYLCHCTLPIKWPFYLLQLFELFIQITLEWSFPAVHIHHSCSNYNYKKLTGQHSSRKSPLTGLEGMVYIEATEGNEITPSTLYSAVMLPCIEVLKQHSHFVIGKSCDGWNCVGLTQISHKK